MTTAADPASFQEALIVLGAAAVVVPLFHRLRISPILGFMVVGVIVGPFGLGALTAVLPLLAAFTITHVDTMNHVAELGVVLLMFMIGLEMLPDRLRLMRRLVFGLGPAQIGLCTAVLAGVAIYILRMPLAGAIVLAACRTYGHVTTEVES